MWHKSDGVEPVRISKYVVGDKSGCASDAASQLWATICVNFLCSENGRYSASSSKDGSESHASVLDSVAITNCPKDSRVEKEREK